METIKKIKHKIYFFTHQSKDDAVISNIVFLKHEEYTVLFYSGSVIGNYQLLKTYMDDIGSTNIDYIVLTTLDTIPLYFHSDLIEKGLNPIVVTDEKIAKQLIPYIPVEQLFVLQEHQFLLEISSDLVLRCYPTPFIHTAGSFMVFDPISNTLISSSLFGSYAVHQIKSENPLDCWIQFHKDFFPGSDYLKPVLKKLENLSISTILPQYGPRIESSQVRIVMDALYQTDFYNNNLLLYKISNTGRDYNYEVFCNQILKRWIDVYSKDEVLSIFNETDISIDAQKNEIKQTTLNGYQLWHRFFEIVYDKKGPAWLSVAEPIVNKLHSMYQILIPVIYNSVIVTTQSKVIELGEVKDSLTKRLDALQENLQSTLDRLSRDPITSEYNEVFFKQYLSEDIDKRKNNIIDRDIVCIFVDIDQIKLLNTTFSKEAGDETLKNLAYLLNQLRKTDQIIFKRNGPGFIVYLSDSVLADAIIIAEQFRNKVSDSDAFIQPITISVSIVRLNEFDFLYKDKDNVVDQLFSRGEYRLKLAAFKGGNQIIDEMSKVSKIAVGKVLLVDTEELTYLMLNQALRKENYELIYVKNGAEALDVIAKIQIDFIICDKTVSKLDAISFKQILNESTETKMIPFLMTSYNKNKELMIRANEVQIDYVLIKPFLIEEVVGYIKRRLQGRELL